MTQNNDTQSFLHMPPLHAPLKELCDVINNRPRNSSEYWTLFSHLKSQEWEQIEHGNNDAASTATLLPSYLRNKLLFRSTRDKNLMVELATYTHLYHPDTHDATQVMAVFDLAQKEMLVATDIPSDTKAQTMPITEAALQRLFRDHNISRAEASTLSATKAKLRPALGN